MGGSRRAKAERAKAAKGGASAKAGAPATRTVTRQTEVDDEGPREGVSELSIDDAMKVAQGMLKSGFLDAAAEIYRRVLAAVPDNVNAQHFLGLALFQRGDRDEG